MGLFFWKKKKDEKLTQAEIEQLKDQLKVKMEEFRAIYKQLVESGETELPEDILESVAGGFGPIVPTTPPPVHETVNSEDDPSYDARKS